LVQLRNLETKKRFLGPSPNCHLILYPNLVTVKITVEGRGLLVV
jgi:hypothetical protein